MLDRLEYASMCITTRIVCKSDGSISGLRSAELPARTKAFRLPTTSANIRWLFHLNRNYGSSKVEKCGGTRE